METLFRTRRPYWRFKYEPQRPSGDASNYCIYVTNLAVIYRGGRRFNKSSLGDFLFVGQISFEVALVGQVVGSNFRPSNRKLAFNPLATRGGSESPWATTRIRRKARLLSAAALPSLGPSLVTSLCVEIFSRDKCPPVGGKMSYVVASDIEISPSYAINREQGYPTAAPRPSPKSTACVGSAEKRASSAVAKGLNRKGQKWEQGCHCVGGEEGMCHWFCSR